MHFHVWHLFSLQTFYQRKPQGLNGALQDLGITFQGREHSGKSYKATSVDITLSPKWTCILTHYHTYMYASTNSYQRDCWAMIPKANILYKNICREDCVCLPSNYAAPWIFVRIWGISFNIIVFSGLDDAKNTARLAWRMMSDGCVMQITKTLAGVRWQTMHVLQPPKS